MNRPHFRLAQTGLALGVLLALVIAPQTRWLVRLQTLTILHQYHPLPCDFYTTSAANDFRLYQAAAARRPDDFLIQYGLATAYPSDQAVRNLRALTQRFPKNPALFANLLRYDNRNVNLNRTDDYTLLGQPVPKDAPHFPVLSPVTLADYDRDAAAGERVDPGNAYFPYLRAYGLFAAHRDAEALAAVKRAAVLPIWNEYLTTDDEAHWRLHTAAFGDPGALGQDSIAATQILWQYGHYRQTARLVAYQAVLTEQAGHAEQGLALREALRRCGDLMRVQSTLLIGSMIGTAISAISETRPGGAPYREDPPGLPPEQRAQRRLELYCAYAIKINHPEAARRAREEEAIRRSVRVLGDNYKFPDWTGPIVHLTLWWLADLALLLNVGWLLVLGLLAAWRVRRPAAETPRMDWKAGIISIALALGLWLLLGLFTIFLGDGWGVLAEHVEFDWRETFGALGVLAFIIWIVSRAMLRLPPAQRRAVWKTAALMPVIAGAVWGLFALAQWLAGPLAEIPAGLRLLTGQYGTTNSDEEQAKQTQTLLLCTAAMLTVPLLMALGFTLAVLVRRLPISRALASGFYRLALPAASLLIIVYGGLLLGALRQDRFVRELTHQNVYGGGRYFAAQDGQKWPGPVR